MNVNLVVVNEAGDDVWLDLYEEQPIKLTFNIEDIVTGTPKAEFTRKFRLPATNINYDFFSTAFEIVGVDFNPGLKYIARIVVDGTDFRQGELRLQQIYRNEVTGKIDYACVFIGSAKGLSSEIGEATIGDIDWSDYTAPLTLADITSSWLATPETPGNQTAGLQNGNLLYPIVDFGNTYDAGVAQETKISLNHTGPNGSFDQQSHPLKYNRLKPMVRMREIMRRMFEDNGFSFTGNFLTDNAEVAKMYISAWGNEDSISINEQNSELARSQRNFSQNIFFDGQSSNPTFPTIISDPGGNMSANGYYTIPANGNYTGLLNLNMRFTHIENTTSQWYMILGVGGTATYSYRFTLAPGSGPCAGLGTSFTVELDSGGGYGVIYSTNTGVGGAPICGFDGFSPGESFTADEFIYNWTLGLSIGQTFTAGQQFVTIGPPIPFPGNNDSNQISVENGFLEITDAVGEFAISPLFNNQYKQIDLLKDIVTMFRLVMVPDPLDTTSFLIIPWNDYIGRGAIKDWSNKLVKNRDVTIRPLLLDQKDKTTFTMAIDSDYYNTENQLVFNEVFGTKKLDSVYDILEGEKIYSTKLAATPCSQIESYNSNWDDFLIPLIHTREVNDSGETEYKPIKPKTRILYYNGAVSTNGDQFYMEDEGTNTVSFTEFPVVSYSTQMPQTGPNNRSMLFEKELSYDQSGNALNPFGQDLYGRYWSQYMELLYNKDSRKVTAYFVLDTDDVINFRYNDVIYIEGVYYYVEKIYDAPLGKKAEVKVDLITLKNYRPNVTAVPPPSMTLWENITENWESITDNWENV